MNLAIHAACLVVLLVGNCHASPARGAEPASFSTAEANAEGVLAHRARSALQGGETEIRVLLPPDLRPEERLPTVYVLPVEAGREARYGDGLTEIQRGKLSVKYRAIYVAPTFFHLPWYVNHASDPQLRQETYFVSEVIPFIERTYPARREASGRLLLGFSKSGWGAVSLLLRHPETFGRVAAWDAPLMMSRLGQYGTTPIFGAEEVLALRALPAALERFDAPEKLSRRLILTSYGSFRDDHQRFHALLEQKKIAHEYRDGPQRKHDWHSGWVAESLELLFAEPGK